MNDGPALPASWSVECAIPLTFIGLRVLAGKNKHGLVAAVVGGSVAVAAIGLPYHLGLLVGTASGIAAGMASEGWLE